MTWGLFVFTRSGSFPSLFFFSSNNVFFLRKEAEVSREGAKVLWFELILEKNLKCFEQENISIGGIYPI